MAGGASGLSAAGWGKCAVATGRNDVVAGRSGRYRSRGAVRGDRASVGPPRQSLQECASPRTTRVNSASWNWLRLVNLSRMSLAWAALKLLLLRTAPLAALVMKAARDVFERALLFVVKGDELRGVGGFGRALGATTASRWWRARWPSRWASRPCSPTWWASAGCSWRSRHVPLGPAPHGEAGPLQDHRRRADPLAHQPRGGGGAVRTTRRRAARLPAWSR